MRLDRAAILYAIVYPDTRVDLASLTITYILYVADNIGISISLPCSVLITRLFCQVSYRDDAFDTFQSCISL